MKVLLTGTAGFIGSSLAEQLCQLGIEVEGIDNFDPFYPRVVKEENLTSLLALENFTFREGDIRDATFMADCGHFDAIIHIAAKAGVRPSIADPEAYVDVNIKGTQILLELAKHRGCKKFIFASSSSVYGVNPNVPWSEDMSLLPISPYASSKLSCEMLGHVYTQLYGIQFLALRFFTVYGPRQRPDLAIHKFTKHILDDLPITLFGDGSTSRDYTFIDDIVDGIVKALHYEDSLYEVINLASSNCVSLQKLVITLQEVIGRKARLEYTTEQPGDVRITYADITKAHKLLQYKPKTDLKEGLSKFFDWYKKSHS